MASGFRLFCLLFFAGGRVTGRWRGKLIDMSHPYDQNTLYYDGNTHFNLSTFATSSPNSRDVWWEVKMFSMPEHGGTHIDAPNHFLKNKRSVDKIPISHFIGPAVVIDAVKKAEKNQDYEVTIADLREWEAEYGRIPKGAIIMLNFNWGKRWPNAEKVFGLVNGTSHFPGLHPDAAKWLVTKRPYIHGVGTDCISIDHGPSRLIMSHRTLLKHNVYILENLANVKAVPNFSTVFAFPMKIAGGTGGPTRVIASIGCKARKGKHRKRTGVKKVGRIRID